MLRGGTVDVLLCEGLSTSGHVDGEQLTQLRLITPAGTTTVDPDPTDDPPPAGLDDLDPAPEPDDDLPMTGADVASALILGAALVLAGGGLVRVGRAERGARAG